jgi:hypothetical protein
VHAERIVCMNGRAAPRRVLVTGATGLIGGALAARLAAAGAQVMRLSRRAGSGAVFWDPARGRLNGAPLAGVEAVFHFSGESLAGGLWTAAKRVRVIDSRVKGTQLLCETLATLSPRPRVLISASAVGWYGDRGDERLTEASERGSGFFADAAEAWEQATAPAAEAGVRVVRLRIGVVLARAGGVLGPLKPLFGLGLGGRLGSGRQWMSWVALDDLIHAILHVLAREELRGAINATSPEPVTNAEFTRALAAALRRPALLPAPAFALRLVLGPERANGLLLASERAEPARLLASGFQFQLPRIDDALRAAVGGAR